MTAMRPWRVRCWQAGTNGRYENQPDDNLRGRFQADEEGSFDLVGLVPTPYPVPIDGPAGELMRLAKRQPNRSAHICFIVSAPKYRLQYDFQLKPGVSTMPKAPIP
jgi:catechol 1,2-dioxygenase